MSRHTEIMTFIRTIRESHSEMVNIFTLGSCLNFYLILSQVYPDAVVYYDCNHIITRIGDKYYDITGEVARGRHLLLQEIYRPDVSDRVKAQMLAAEYRPTCTCEGERHL